MSNSLTLTYEKENFSQIPRDGYLAEEEKATLGRLIIKSYDSVLTKGESIFEEKVQDGPLIANYYCAEWLAWNYWRLRWEGKPENPSPLWGMAHRMATIGHGYSWPDITIYSDGERVVLSSKPSPETDPGSFQFIIDWFSIIQANEFEKAVDDYVECVLSQLQDKDLKETNLAVLWKELTDERKDSLIADRRKLEALLGSDPDEGDEEYIDRLMGDADLIGKDAVREIAAQCAGGKDFLNLKDFKSIAEKDGFEGRLNDAVQLDSKTEIPIIGSISAWKIGKKIARSLRQQNRLGNGPVSDKKLAELAGVSASSLVETSGGRKQNISFMLENEKETRFVFRSKWKTGRRFDLARLIGDNIIFKNNENEKVKLAGRSYTYHQKMQRAFATEFLCPVESLREELDDYYDEDGWCNIAKKYEVSEQTVRSSLLNHGLIERDQFDDDIQANRYQNAVA